jgi:hypothetical protein
MRFRKLRIAWSVAWGIVAVLLCVLWMRSYQTGEVFSRTDGKGWVTAFGSNAGSGYYVHMFIPNANAGYVTQRSAAWELIRSDVNTSGSKFGWAFSSTKKKVQLPYYLPTLTLIAFVALPWIRQLRYRFSLRTLLIATTLIAAVLGLIVSLL